MKKDLSTLQRAFQAWNAAAPLRGSRDRQKRYTFGDQWLENITASDGSVISEKEFFIKSGKRPLTNNLLRRMVRTIVGLYRTRAAEAKAYSADPASADMRNSLPELDARMLEEYIISGCAIQRVVEENRGGGPAVWIDNVDPRRFFVNAFSDPRGADIDFVGMLHDMSWPQLVNRFAHGSRSAASALRQLAMRDGDEAYFSAEEVVGVMHPGDAEFFSSRPGKVRVVETWSLEGRQVNVRGRVRMEMKWLCRWLTTDGLLLDEYASDFAHGSHPFVVKFYPLIDGEVHSFVEDAIDQQRNINRHLVLADSILASSAKGTLLFPVDQLVDDLSLEKVGQLWSQTDSVIPISGRGQQLPTQVMTASSSPATDMLQLHMKLFDRTTGVGDALLGQNVSAATGANLYNAQVRNATTQLADLLDSFDAFILARNNKMKAM